MPTMRLSTVGILAIVCCSFLPAWSQKVARGRTIAIVDAFDDPNAESDLAVYRSTFVADAICKSRDISSAQPVVSGEVQLLCISPNARRER